MPKQNAQSAEVLTTAGPTEVRLRGRHGPESEPRFEEFRTERGTNPFRSDLIVLSGALLLLPLFFGGNQTEAQLILVLVALGGAFLSLAGKRGTQYRAFAQSSATHSSPARPIVLCGIGSAALCVLQTVVLPHVLANLLPGPIRDTISLLPSSTLHQACFLLSLTLVFALVSQAVAHERGSAERGAKDSGSGAARNLLRTIIAAALICAGIALLHWLSQSVLYFGRFGGGRAISDASRAHWPFVNPNHLAVMLEIGAMLTMSAAIARFLAATAHSHSSPQTKSILVRCYILLRQPAAFGAVVLRVAATVFLSVVCLLTASRTGVVLLLLGLVVQAITARDALSADAPPRGSRTGRMLWRVVLAVSILVPTFFLAGERAGGQLETRFVQGIQGRSMDRVRSELRQASYQIIRENPLVGVGLGAWHLAAREEVSPELLPYSLDYAHNEYLQLMSETGAIGLSLAVFALLIFSSQTVSALKRLHSQMRSAQATTADVLRRRSVELTGSALALLLPLLHAAVDFPLHIPALALALTVLAAIHLQAAAQGYLQAIVAESCAESAPGLDSTGR